MLFAQLTKKLFWENEEITRQNGRLLKAVLVNTLLSFYSEAVIQHTPWPKCNVVPRFHKCNWIANDLQDSQKGQTKARCKFAEKSNEIFGKVAWYYFVKYRRKNTQIMPGHILGQANNSVTRFDKKFQILLHLTFFTSFWSKSNFHKNHGTYTHEFPYNCTGK